MLLLCYACSGKKEKEGSLQREPVKAEDSLSDSEDTLVMDSVAKAAIPKNLDETFDDFVYTYAKDRRFQLLRTRFPLPFVTDSTKTTVDRKEWIHDDLYTHQEFYNMLFDKESDMDYEKKTDVNKVYVAWLFLDKQKTRRYNFERVNGEWTLLNITEKSLRKNPNEDFLKFFYRFCNDSVYQRNHVEQSLKFTTSDPEDEFNVIEAFISVDQWFVFRPALPHKKMTNINYGQPYSAKTQQKIVAFRGIGNGYSNTLFFSRKGGEWILTAYEDFSN